MTWRPQIFRGKSTTRPLPLLLGWLRIPAIDCARKTPKGRRRSDRRTRAKGEAMSTEELERTIVELEEEMLAAAEELRFEYAAKLRDEIKQLRHELDEIAAAS